MKQPSFSHRLIEWQQQHGRHHLPWQNTDPYGVWLSEIMLQQTQVATVLDYYPRFLAAFPTVQALANADQDTVLSLWAGLGYYSRARNLHQAARQIVYDFQRFPANRAEWESLRGVGRSTAAAICAFTLHQRETILDGNVKRVLCRVFALDGDLADKTFERQLWTLAETLLPEQPAQMPAYTQGLMDLGATVCKRSRPNCIACPMADICQAKAQNRIAELPRKKIATTVTEQTLFWLHLCNTKGQILLEKRPQKGIWAGLYCLPCFEDKDSLQAFIEQTGYSCRPHADEQLSHRLTHRLLHIQIFQLSIEHYPPHSGSLWTHCPHHYALPRPLAQYLNNPSTLF